MKARSLMVLMVVLFAGVSMAEDVADEFIDLLRSDLRADKQALVEYAMDLGEADAKIFETLYREYEAERTALGDRVMEMMEKFPEAYEMTGPTPIDTLAQEWLKLQDDRNKLTRKYYKKAQKQLSPRTAARWMQIEHRIRLLIDLQLASVYPLIERVPR